MKFFSNKISLSAVLALVFFSVAIPVLAADAGSLWTFTENIVPCGTSASGFKECDWNQLIVLANNIVAFLVTISVSLAVIACCYAGYLYITAFGETGKVEQAHNIFRSSLIGIFFVLCGWLIVATILKVLVQNDNAEINKIVPYQGVKTIQGQ